MFDREIKVDAGVGVSLLGDQRAVA